MPNQSPGDHYWERGPTGIVALYSKLGLSGTDLKATAEALQSQIPARGFGQPSEIARAVVFLASHESALTVGSELIVDGGLSLQRAIGRMPKALRARQ